MVSGSYIQKIIFLFFCTSVFYSLNARGVRIFFTSSLNGYMKDCLCKITPQPGLSKRHSLLKALNFQANQDILLETGDFINFPTTANKARAIFSAYRQMGYHAIGIGRNEWVKGKDFLKTHLRPLSSGNIKMKRLFFQRSLGQPIVSLLRNNKSIGIINLTSSTIARTNTSMSFKDPQQAITNLQKKYRKNVWIINFYGPFDRARKIAQKNPTAILITGMQKIHPKNGRFTTAGNNRIFHLGGDGEYLGIIYLDDNLQFQKSEILKPDIQKIDHSPLILGIMKKYGVPD